MAFQIEGAMEMSSVNPIAEKFKIAIVGEPGDGKSWLAASCATETEPAFHFDFDGRKQSIAGKQFVTSKTYTDVDYPTRMPLAWTEFLTDLMRMEEAKSRNDLPFKWFIFDSATYISVAALNNIMYNTPSLRRQVVAAGRTTYIPKSFDTYKAEMSEVIGALSRLMELGSVIMCFHLGFEKDVVNSTKEETKYTNQLAVTPPRYGDLLALFNDQWLVKAEGPGSYKVQTAPDWSGNGFFKAKSTLRIDSSEKPNIREMLQKHMTNVGK